ncbi:MAG: aspartate--tRNA(Asn) ligase [Nanoarchaeota archaeon]|nr:aspartate--tRNA(Asn) ligase [Nanoarchaeota archaeon]
MLEKRVPIKDAFNLQSVAVAGWVESYRDLKKIKFIILRDSTGTLQITMPKAKVPDEVFSLEPTQESYIFVKGKMIDSKEARGGKELIPSEIKILSKAETPIPIDISGKIETDLSKRLDWRFIDIRNPKVNEIFKLQSKIINTLSRFCDENEFIRINTSKLVGVPTEGGTEYFEVDYFDKKAYLAQSPQFYKELALSGGLEKVYEIGNVYRAEPHHTIRHLCEYNSFDVEWITDNFDELLNFEEKMLRYLFEKIKNENAIQVYNVTLNFPKKIPRIKFGEAKKIVEKMGVETEEGDLTHAGEKALCEWAKKEHDSDFVFLTHFPFKHKVFYAKKEGENTLSFDLLYKGIEITTGGLREENYEKRKSQMIEKGLNPETFDHLRFFKYGIPPHGGFAIGIERLTMLILGLQNIREASLTPRDPERLTP